MLKDKGLGVFNCVQGLVKGLFLWSLKLDSSVLKGCLIVKESRKQTRSCAIDLELLQKEC